MDEQMPTKPRLNLPSLNTKSVARDMSVEKPTLIGLEPTNRSNEPSCLSVFSEQKPFQKNIALVEKQQKNSNFNNQEQLTERNNLNIIENLSSRQVTDDEELTSRQVTDNQQMRPVTVD